MGNLVKRPSPHHPLIQRIHPPMNLLGPRPVELHEAGSAAGLISP